MGDAWPWGLRRGIWRAYNFMHRPPSRPSFCQHPLFLVDLEPSAESIGVCALPSSTISLQAQR